MAEGGGVEPSSAKNPSIFKHTVQETRPKRGSRSWHFVGTPPPRPKPFRKLAVQLTRIGSNCDESCAHVHDGHGCEHEGHVCGCPHSDSYDFEWEPPDSLSERWSDVALAGLIHFLSRLPGKLSAEETETRLEWWWRGENHKLRRAVEAFHRRTCERGRGMLVSRVTGEVILARCKSWRECEVCAWVYGKQVERLLNQVKGLRAFVVFRMPQTAVTGRTKSISPHKPRPNEGLPSDGFAGSDNVR